MTYRNINRPKIPLVVGIMAMFINIIVNYILIFGLYGFPKMGIQGAAMGTCIAQIVSLLVHILFAYYTHQPFIGTLQEMFTFDMHFVKPILQKTQSIIFNELLFGFGSTLFIKAFGALGTRFNGCVLCWCKNIRFILCFCKWLFKCSSSYYRGCHWG